MKTLKIILYAVLISSITFSCTTDNYDMVIPVDNLLGTWQLTTSSKNGINTKLSQCDKKDLIIFGETQLMYVFNKNESGSKCKVETLKKDFTAKGNIIMQDDGIDITIEAHRSTLIILNFETIYKDELYIYRETYVRQN